MSEGIQVIISGSIGSGKSALLDTVLHALMEAGCENVFLKHEGRKPRKLTSKTRLPTTGARSRLDMLKNTPIQVATTNQSLPGIKQ